MMGELGQENRSATKNWESLEIPSCLSVNPKPETPRTPAVGLEVQNPKQKDTLQLTVCYGKWTIYERFTYSKW
jgi:hypothetical protein